MHRSDRELTDRLSPRVLLSCCSASPILVFSLMVESGCPMSLRYICIPSPEKGARGRRGQVPSFLPSFLLFF